MSPGGQPGWGGRPSLTLTLIPMPEHHAPLACLGEDPGNLAPADQHVVRKLELGLEAGGTVRLLSRSSGGDTGQLGQALREQSGTSWSEQSRLVPRGRASADPSRPRPAVCSPRRRALLQALWFEQELRGGGRLEVGVRPPEAPAQAVAPRRGRERVRHEPYTRPAVQPPLRKRRQIRQDPRPERPLVYERLSDPILVKRAKDGDSRALAALCERHAPRVERLAAQVLADPEDARDAAQEALAKLCIRLRQFRGRVAVRDLAPPARGQHVPGRVRPPAGAPLRAAARGRACLGRRGSCARKPTWPSCASARRKPGGSLAGAGERGRPEGRARLLVRRDLGSRGHAGREPRNATRTAPAQACAHGSRTTQRRDGRWAARRSRRSCLTGSRSC
jgi:hypothetical protein